MEESTDFEKRELDEQYIGMALEKYERIKSTVSKGKRPTRSEKELISLIFNKIVDPYYYWAEARVKGENENVGNKDPKESSVKDISELVTKYDLDISEMNSTPSRIKLKKYIDKGFEELNVRMKKIGYSYERGSRPQIICEIAILYSKKKAVLLPCKQVIL